MSKDKKQKIALASASLSLFIIAAPAAIETEKKNKTICLGQREKEKEQFAMLVNELQTGNSCDLYRPYMRVDSEQFEVGIVNNVQVFCLITEVAKNKVVFIQPHCKTYLNLIYWYITCNFVFRRGLHTLLII